MSTPKEKLYQLKITNVIIFSFSFPTSFPQDRLEVLCVLIQVTFKKTNENQVNLPCFQFQLFYPLLKQKQAIPSAGDCQPRQTQMKLSSGPPARFTCISSPALAGGRTAVILGLWLSVAIPEGTSDRAHLGLHHFPLFCYPSVMWALVCLPSLSSVLSPQLFFPVDATRSIDAALL